MVLKSVWKINNPDAFHFVGTGKRNDPACQAGTPKREPTAEQAAEQDQVEGGRNLM